MDKIKKIITILLHLFIFFTLLQIFSRCTNDYTKNLGGGYFYRHDGYPSNSIHSKHSNGGEIPSAVLDYNYNKIFIIAKQRPILTQDILYKTYEYQLGKDTTYYWIIIKNKTLVIGPLDSILYEKKRIEYNIPNTLKFKN